jgi:hypothetical protein
MARDQRSVLRAARQLSRRQVLHGAIGLGVAGRIVGRPQVTHPDYLAWAESAYRALQRNFYVPEMRLYREVVPPKDARPYAYIWPHSQGLAATLALAEVPSLRSRYRADVVDRLPGLEYYWDPTSNPPGYDSYVRPPHGHGGDKYYDDNAWIGLELMRAHAVTGDPAILNRARQVLDFVVSGWDASPDRPAPGGVKWTQAHWNLDRNTVSTAPGAALGFLLYERTGERWCLDWGTRMYEWTVKHMLAPNGLFWDRINTKGVIEESQHSYNQGAMISAGLYAYRVTREPAYLKQAETTADVTVEQIFGPTDYYEDPALDAIFFRNLMRLYRLRRKRAYRTAMQSYTEEVWQRWRNATGPITLLQQAAVIQLAGGLAGTL